MTPGNLVRNLPSRSPPNPRRQARLDVSPILRTGLCAVLAVTSCALAASPPLQQAAADSAEIHIARSALLAIDAAPTDDSLALYIKHVADQSEVTSSDVVVAV